MSKGIKRRLSAAESRVTELINAQAREGGMYARGLAGEGYLGGYRDALSDVLLLLNGVDPPKRHSGFWER